LSPARFASLLTTLGALALLVATLWWATTFSRLTGGFAGALQDRLSCLYSADPVCRVAAGVLGVDLPVPPYDPQLFWIGAVMAGIGLVGRIGLRR